MMHQKHITATSVVPGFSLISVVMLGTRFLWAHKSGRDKDESTTQYSVDPNGSRFDKFTTDRLMRNLVLERDRGQWVPTLSGVIKAGDEGIYSSSLSNTMQGEPGELSLEKLHESFAQELKSRPYAERSAYPRAMSEFITNSRKGLQRSQTVRGPRDGRAHPLSRSSSLRNSIDLSERGMLRSRSIMRAAPTLVSTFNQLPLTESAHGGPAAKLSWTGDVQHAQNSKGKTSITVSATELTALSIILGSPVALSKSEHTQNRAALVSLDSAYGISISGSQSDGGHFYVSFQRQRRSASQLPAKGSGSSTLFAKHLASGSIPFAQDKNTVSSMLITPDTFRSIQTGHNLHVQSSAVKSSASDFLTRLPASRHTHLHTLVKSKASTSTPLLLHSIAELPFTGGLVPLASKSVIDTIQFISAAGLQPARLLSRLEALVAKVHQHSPGLQLFGPLYEPNHARSLFRERERLSRLAIGTNTSDSLADKTARMHRYTTLLERLMALVPDMKPDDVLAAVREATKKELERSYEDAVAAARVSNANRDIGIDLHFQSSFPCVASSRATSDTSTRTRKSHLSSLSSPSTPGTPQNETLTSPRTSSIFPPQNLGKQVEILLKADLPLDVQSIAGVARLVLVAWTLSVQAVAWEDREEGIRLDGLEGFPAEIILS